MKTVYPPQTKFAGGIKIPAFKVAGPYLNLLVNLEFFNFLGKNHFMHFERPFKMHKIIYFFQKINMCAYPT